VLPVSVVIITKNEAIHIVDCIQSAKQISGDIIIVDTGSTDDTIALARQQGAKVMAERWSGYGHARNTGAKGAVNDWILSLDADERISAEMAAAIRTCRFEHGTIYKVKRINYIGGRQIRFGPHGSDHPTRLYNRHEAAWDLWPVHEGLICKAATVKKIGGAIQHYSASSLAHYKEKMEQYAVLSSRKYQQQGKKATWIKRHLAPSFHFIKACIFQLGFLDGYTGLVIAKTISHYTSLKYRYLHELNKAGKGPQDIAALEPDLSSNAKLKERI
jgi:glycosyltransferase involved in cell wall biosynthesis